MNAMADLSLELSSQAWAVAHLLSERETDFFSWNEKFLCYRGSASTAALYNGRENGICFSYREFSGVKTLNFFVFEHRNSDEICVVRWECDHLWFNPPTIKDIPEDVYPDKYTHWLRVPYGEVGKVADAIHKECSRFFTGGEK